LVLIGLQNNQKKLIVSVFNVISMALVARGMVFTPTDTTKYLEELEAFHEKVLVNGVKKVKKVKGKNKCFKKTAERTSR